MYIYLIISKVKIEKIRIYIMIAPSSQMKVAIVYWLTCWTVTSLQESLNSSHTIIFTVQQTPLGKV